MNERISKVKTRLLEYGYIDNEWMDKYLEMLEVNLNTLKSRKSTQAHHAIPLTNYWISTEPYDRRKTIKLARRDADNFEVNLLYKDHLLIHSYLTLCTNLDKDQARYEAQVYLRQKQASPLTRNQVKLEKTLSKQIKANDICHQNAVERKRLRQVITQLHEEYVSLCAEFPSMYYARKDEKVKKVHFQWKQAVKEFNNFYTNLKN